MKNENLIFNLEHLKSKFPNQILNVPIFSGRNNTEGYKALEISLTKCPKMSVEENASSDVEMEEISKKISKNSRKICYEDAMISTRYFQLFNTR